MTSPRPFLSARSSTRSSFCQRPAASSVASGYCTKIRSTFRPAPRARAKSWPMSVRSNWSFSHIFQARSAGPVARSDQEKRLAVRIDQVGIRRAVGRPGRRGGRRDQRQHQQECQQQADGRPEAERGRRVHDHVQRTKDQASRSRSATTRSLRKAPSPSRGEPAARPLPHRPARPPSPSLSGRGPG